MPGLSGEIEELHAEASRHEVQSELVRQAVIFMPAGGAGSIYTRICVGRECPEKEKLSGAVVKITEKALQTMTTE